jgi:hypothetical protein
MYKLCVYQKIGDQLFLTQKYFSEDKKWLEDQAQIHHLHRDDYVIVLMEFAMVKADTIGPINPSRSSIDD